MIRYWLLLLFFFGCWIHLESAQDDSKKIEIKLNGHLSQQVLSDAFDKLRTPKVIDDGYLFILIDSNSGDITAMLEFARKLYILKSQQHFKIVIYMADKVLGPAAILPFLADEIFISPYVSWGDIALGSEGVFPANLLRNRVSALINPENSKRDLLLVLAAGMSDKAAQVVNDHGWKIGTITSDAQQAISMPGEALVINQTQIQDQKLTNGVVSPEDFALHWQLPKPTVASSEEAVAGLDEPAQKLQQSLESHLHYSRTEPNRIGLIQINDRNASINQATWLYVKNALDYYKQSKPLFVILELNTPGGEVFAAEQISDALKELDTQYNIPVVCFINNWAISAGAMLAYSCRFISIVKDASMGAAEPVIAGEGSEMKTASEKVNSALRTDFANRAAFYDRNPLIAESMVDKDMLLVWRHGHVVKLDNDQQIRSTGLDPDIVISPKGKLLTLSSEEMMRYGVADILLPPTKTSQVSSQDIENGRWSAEKMLLFQAPFFKEIPNAFIDSYQMDWKARFFAFLASPMISSLLLLGMILGFYMEMSTPGFGVPGSIAVACLVLIILSSFALEIASWLEVALVFAGLGIIITDLFLLPTFGLLGFFGLLFFGAGLLGMLLPGLHTVEYEFDTQTFNAAGNEVLERLGWLSGAIIAATACIALLARYATPTFTKYSKLVLQGNEQDASKGYIAGENPADLPAIGSNGTVFSTLRPAGKVMIHGKIYDALSSGEYIEKDESIYVTRLEGGTLIVKSLKEGFENNE